MFNVLYVQNFGCLREVFVSPLMPLHAFIGPNDSGKSTILRAAAFVSDPGRQLPPLALLASHPAQIVIGVQAPKGKVGASIARNDNAIVSSLYA